MERQPLVGQGLLTMEIPRSPSYTRQDSSGRVIRPIQRQPLTQHAKIQATYIQATGRIRTRNPSKLAAPDPRLLQCGHRDRHCEMVQCEFVTMCVISWNYIQNSMSMARNIYDIKFCNNILPPPTPPPHPWQPQTCEHKLILLILQSHYSLHEQTTGVARYQ